MRKIDPRIIPLLLIPLGLALWAGALQAPFALDDKMYVLHNPDVRTLDSLLYINDSRYVTIVTFALNYMVGGLIPFDYHLVNVLIHIGVSMAIYGLVRVSFTAALTRAGDKGDTAVPVAAATTAALIFLVHPLHTQAVTYISQRSASLATLFYVLAVYFYARSRIADGDGGRPGGTGRGWFAASLIAVILAMKTKETAFTLPFAITLYELVFFKGAGARRLAKRLWPFYLTLPIVPLSVFGPEMGIDFGYGGGEETRRLKVAEAFGPGRGEYLITQLCVIVSYLRLLFYPAGLRFVYDYPDYGSLFAPAPLASLLFLLALLAAAAWALRISRRGGSAHWALFAFGVFWFFIALSVESFMTVIQHVIFEHRAYLPSVGVAVAFTALAFRAHEILKKLFAPALHAGAFAALLLTVTALPLAAALVERNGVWADDVAFLSDNLEKTPASASVYYMRGIAFMDRGEYDKAVEDYTAAIDLKPTLKEAYHNRAIANSSAGRYALAIEDLNAAAAMGPENVRVYLNRAFTYALIDDCDSAMADIRRAYGVDRPLAEHYLSSPFLSKALGELSEKCGG